jgi:chondroitin AC lyase
MSKLLFISLLLFLFITGFTAPSNQLPQDSSMEILRINLISNILKNRPKDQNIAGMLLLIRPDGSFSDINYSDRTRGGWPVCDHLDRLLAMSISWKSPQSSYFNTPALKKPLFNVLNHWLRNDYINPNWWYPEIGVPQLLGKIMVLLKDDLTEREISDGLKILNRAKMGRTGQNKVWLAQNVIYRSLLTNDYKLIELAAKSISEEVTITESEGIQPDFSFHQHGPQQQFGNYGLAYATDMSNWALIFEGTPFSFDQQKIEILRNYLLNGIRWVVWNNKFDISACGRQLFPNAQTEKAHMLADVYKTFTGADSLFRGQYRTAMNDFDGNIHFWRSDMTIHRRAGFYSSVKMASNRVAGAESCNSENIQGYHMGDGATYFYQSGEEYTDIFPFWDWKKIPGTTTLQDGSNLPILNASGYRIKSDFVGGVSDGMNGLSTMQYNRDTLFATKSWFFFDNAIICLGAGIKTDQNKSVTTSVNQSFLKSEVLISQNGKSSVLKNGLYKLQNIHWIIQDHWGYYFPVSASLNLENGPRRGAWNRVVAPMSDKALNTNIFQLWIDHGNRPQNGNYSYIVLPGATPENIEESGGEFEIISNTTELQSVRSKNGTITGIVFYQKGSCPVNPGMIINADNPCVVLFTSKNGKEAISISDPTHLQSIITLTINCRTSLKAGESVSFNLAKNQTTISVSLPGGNEAGRTTTIY